MADTKVSALTAATVVNAGDYLLIVQGGNSLKIDIQTLLQKMPTRNIILEAAEALAVGTIAVPVAVATNVLTSKLTASTVAGVYTLAAGTHGMEKFIVCSAVQATPFAVITITSGAGITTATFNAVGDTLHLKNVDGLWYVAGSNSVVIA